MAKDPYNPTVKAFKKNGLLEEILYPDGRPEDQYSNNRWEEMRERESGSDSIKCDVMWYDLMRCDLMKCYVMWFDEKRLDGSAAKHWF